jgi:hypothetical protein
MATRKIEFVSFNKKENPDLIAKLNAVAPYEYLPVHTLAKRVLLGYLDKRITELNIPVESVRPTGG